MTREEAIKRFQTLLLHVDTECVMGMETAEAINMAIKALEQPEPQWIPCSERLPEKNDYYLVQALMNNDIFVASWQGCYWNVKTPIVAWMPLPAPYKGGEKE